MPDDIPDPASTTLASAYGPAYYASHCGPSAYERNDHWLGIFGTIADRLVGSFAPQRVFDAGCALGMLVESLWDRGVQAYGRDVSEWAIAHVRPDVRPCCDVGSIADSIEGGYDLLACIEVLEHMEEAEALQAIRAMAAAAPRILFSSSPVDFDEPTHCNVRPPIYWLCRWAEAGFAPSTTHDAGYLAPHAYVLERSDEGRSPRELTAFADRVRHRVAMSQLGDRLNQLGGEFARVRDEAAASTGQRTALEIALAAADARAETAEHDAARVGEESERRVAAAEEQLRSGLERQDMAAAAAMAEAAVRRTAEDRQLRAGAAQRAMEARAEAAEAKAKLAEASATIERHRQEVAVAREEAAARTREHADALAMADAERRRADSAGREAERLHEAVGEARREVRTIAATRDRLLTSTVWRASWPIRFAGERLLPRLARGAVRRGLSVVWWTATGTLGRRLGRRRLVVRQIRAVEASSLFDAVWYAGRNPDVEASGLDPALHYVTIGAAQGRDPGPAFSTIRYVERQPGIDVARTPALVHFLWHGAEHDLPRHPEPPVAAPAEVARPASPDADPPSEEVAVAFEPVRSAQVSVPQVPATSAQHPMPDDTATPAPVTEAASAPLDEPARVSEPEPPMLRALIAERFIALEPLRTYAAPHDRPRVTVVTDSINAGSLYGGVGTALILGVLLAQRLDAGLRLVTRTEAADDPGRISGVLTANGVAWGGNVELLHAPPGPGGRDIPVGPGDIFLTTSWWSTWATRRAVDPTRIAYLLQEDERGFYPLGDDHLRCTETMGDPGLLYLVNCQLLLAHLAAEGLAPGGVGFEPACPSSTFHVEEQGEWDTRRNFFFYARPHNPRNLYWRGLEAIGAAIEQRVLDPQRWAFHFVGKGAHDLVLPGGVRPQVIRELAWTDYASLVRRMDLGLSLMSTPHPSYPPLDLASSGAVVVTNRYANKTSLQGYSPNILCAEPSVAGLVAGLAQAATLVADRPLRGTNLGRNGMERDWMSALAPVLDVLVDRFGR